MADEAKRAGLKAREVAEAAAALATKKDEGLVDNTLFQLGPTLPRNTSKRRLKSSIPQRQSKPVRVHERLVITLYPFVVMLTRHALTANQKRYMPLSVPYVNGPKCNNFWESMNATSKPSTCNTYGEFRRVIPRSALDPTAAEPKVDNVVPPSRLPYPGSSQYPDMFYEPIPSGPRDFAGLLTSQPDSIASSLRQSTWHRICSSVSAPEQ